MLLSLSRCLHTLVGHDFILFYALTLCTYFILKYIKSPSFGTKYLALSQVTMGLFGIVKSCHAIFGSSHM